MKREFGVVHGLCECKTCGWSTQSYKNAQALAAKHAAAYGHEVAGEVGYMYVYDATDEVPKKAAYDAARAALAEALKEGR